MIALIVDDNEILARTTARMLRAWGWETVEAHDPVAAAAHYAKVDLVVTDWEMPEGGGERVLAECGKPVFVMTANDDVARQLVRARIPVILKPALSQTIGLMAERTVNHSHRCPHSGCAQHFIDTGSPECIAPKPMDPLGYLTGTPEPTEE